MSKKNKKNKSKNMGPMCDDCGMDMKDCNCGPVVKKIEQMQDKKRVHVSAHEPNKIKSHQKKNQRVQRVFPIANEGKKGPRF